MERSTCAIREPSNPQRRYGATILFRSAAAVLFRCWTCKVLGAMNAPHVVSIMDPATGATARILVSLGFNCFSWRPVLQDGSREMLWAHQDFASGNEKPSGSGIPLLFPFPGRIGNARFTFGGREYLLEPADGSGNAIHGFAYNRAWRVIEHSVNRVSGEFHASRDDRAVLKRWPCDFRIRATYTIEGAKLTL